MSKIEEQVIAWRQHLHQMPEFGFEEVKTSEFIAQKLEEFGIEVHRNIGRTGLVGVLKCGDSDRTIGLRADMDALKITEENDFAYKSQNDGMMHACGHDGHTTMLLGAAHELARHKNFDGTVYFIFQPGEEHGVGAKAMIEDGLFDRFKMDAIYAMHNLPGVPEGHFVTNPGSIMASESGFEIEILATGGHAAMPHMGTDPIVVGAQIILALQTVTSRNLSSIHEPAVISVTEFTTNGTTNVIPSSATIKGDTRCFTDEALAKIEAAIERVAAGQCVSAGVEYKYKFTNTFLSTINTPKETAVAVRVAKAIAGEENVDGEAPPFTISEDFSYMQRKVPSCYILVGNGKVGEKGGTALHKPFYDFNDNILMTGARFWTELVKDQLPANA